MVGRYRLKNQAPRSFSETDRHCRHQGEEHEAVEMEEQKASALQYKQGGCHEKFLHFRAKQKYFS